MVARLGLIVGGAVLVLGAAGAVLVVADPPGRDGARMFIGNDFGRMRREALDMFPRGVPVAVAAAGLKALGFKCTPTHRLMANVNAPSVECDSAGRGYPTAPRMQVTVMSRNGALSDIAIGNGVDAIVADARTPDPNPGGVPAARTVLR